jgi:peptide/nickel transport system substrate-binding protein
MLTSRHRRGKWLAGMAAAGALVVTVAACSSGSSSTGAAAGNGTSPSAAGGNQPALVMESQPETSISQAFNPFVNTQAPYQMGATGLIYEPLIQFNLANPTQSYNWLATGYQWSNGGKTITFTIRQGVKWNDGQPLTPADVAFTYNMVKNNADVDITGLGITNVTTSGNTVAVSFKQPEYANIQNVAGVAIVPQHIWSAAGDPGKFTNANPVGTGPYKLSNFTQQGFSLAANPSYWQPVPVKKVFFPVYTSNTAAANALFAGKVTWAGNYIPGLQKNFIGPDAAHHLAYEPSISTNSLMPNLNKWPTNQLAVRQAISAALDRSLVGSEGEGGLETPALNAAGLPLPAFAAYSAPVAALTNSPTADATKAGQILTAAGYKKDAAGFYALNGKEVQFAIEDPSGFSDYAQSGALVAQQLKAAGINASFNGVTTDAWFADIADGHFQAILHWGGSGVSPYNLYNNWLNDAFNKGSNATGDFEGLHNPTINAQLNKVAGDATIAAQTRDLAPIEQYVAKNLPVIPTTTAAEWSEINATHFTGWPTQANGYQSPQPSSNQSGSTGTAEVVLLHLKFVG